MTNAPLEGVGTRYSLIAPAVVIRPILLPLASVNQSAPSGPAVMLSNPLDDVGTGYSLSAPAVVIRPILLPKYSGNQSAPSGPATMLSGKAADDARGYSVKRTDCADESVRTISNKTDSKSARSLALKANNG
jgi:hypothetical protein